MVVLIWIQTGFAMVIFSSGDQGRPHRVHRSGPHRRRERIADVLAHHAALVLPTVGVVTTLIVAVMKVYDIVFAATGGSTPPPSSRST